MKDRKALKKDETLVYHRTLQSKIILYNFFNFLELRYRSNEIWRRSCFKGKSLASTIHAIFLCNHSH